MRARDAQVVLRVQRGTHSFVPRYGKGSDDRRLEERRKGQLRPKVGRPTSMEFGC